MQKEQDPLNLRSLPLVAPPEDDWAVIESALQQHQKRKRAFRYAGAAMAAAATITLVIGLTANTWLSPSGSIAPQTATDSFAQQETSPVLPQDDQAGPTLDSLIALSQQLETRIRSIRMEVGGMPTNSLIYQVELEDLVAQVDDELSMNPESRELWSQRVNLLLDLNQLYQNQLRRDYHRMASL